MGIGKFFSKIIPNEVKKPVKAVAKAVTKTVSKAIPKEIKKAVPNELKKVIDPLGVLDTSKPKAAAAPAGVTGKNKAPEYDETLLKTFNAQLKLQEPLLAANKLYQPQWLELQKQSQASTAEAQMELMKKLYPQAGAIEATYQNQLRQNELQQIQQTLPEYQKSFNALTPGYSEAISGLGQLARNAATQSLTAPQLTNFEQDIAGPQAGSYLSKVNQFDAQNVNQLAGTPELQGFFNKVASADQAAGLAGGVPGSFRMGKTGSASDAAKSAGLVPSARNIEEAAPVSSVANIAGQVQNADRMAAAQTAAAAQAAAGNVPGAQNVSGMRTVDAALQGVGTVPGAQNAISAQSAQAALQLAGNAPTAQNILSAQSAQAALAQAGEVPTAQNILGTQSAFDAASVAGSVPSALNLSNIYGPKLASNIQSLDKGSVDQYVNAMPGMGNYANMLAQQAQSELSAGRGLTPEEQRMADQSIRSAYAARGTALGGQSVAAEVLNRADVANQRYQQRLQNANQAAAGVQSIYQPALQQSLQRQQLGIEYGLGSQQQAFSQAQARDVLNQQLQAQSYGQAMNTQGTAFEQASAKDQMLAQLQAQRYGQLSETQQTGFQQSAVKDQMAAQLQAQRYGQLSNAQQAGFQQATSLDTLAQQAQAQRYSQALGAQTTGFEQAQSRDTLNAQLQAQRYGQLASTQQAGFGQAQAQDAMQQSLQAQRFGQAMGVQTTGFEQAQTKDTLASQLQAQRFSQAMGAQGAGFQQAQTQDVFNRDTQAQKYSQAMGTQGAAFQQAGTRENLGQQVQQQKFSQLMGQQQLQQGAQAQQYSQAMGREQLGAESQQMGFQQALMRGQAQQQRLQAGTALQAGQAQLAAGALGQMQNAQAPILQAYYRQPILQQTVGQAQTMGLANQQAAGNSLFQPESPMAFQSAFLPYQSNIAMQQAQLQADAAKSAGKSSMTGSIIGAGGTAVGLAFAACWVAREVYGQENPLWKVFRSWLFNEAPEWFKNAYIKHGPKIADFIKNKPVLKFIIRKWMDSKIESYISA